MNKQTKEGKKLDNNNNNNRRKKGLSITDASVLKKAQHEELQSVAESN